MIIPTAGGGRDYSADWRGRGLLSRYGVEDVTVLHTYDREVANQEAFVAPLEKASGVWISGGRQWRLVDAYAGTRTLQALKGVLERGGIIGGTSAGATIQGSYLARGDTRTNTIMMGDHEEGFGFLPNVAVDQHVLARIGSLIFKKSYALVPSSSELASMRRPLSWSMVIAFASSERAMF